MEQIGLCLEVAQGPQSLARALVLGAGACQYLSGTVWAYKILPSSKSFRQVGQKLTSLPFKMRWWIFCKLALKESHPREDYKEPISLCRIFLGGADPAKVSFRAPAAFHQAPWIAKAIYILKLYLFQHQFSLTSKEKTSVKELALFVSLVYVRFWHKAPLGIKIPLSNMQLLESIQTEQLWR